jgi:trans-aconitate 2-methyltransferase
VEGSQPLDYALVVSQPSSENRAEWNAAEYHRLSGPQVAFGEKVLSRLPLAGDELVLDAGCGTGRLTAQLLDRLPRGRVVCLDRSRNMLAEARRGLPADRAAFVCAALPRIPLRDAVDVVFSTATFHWVLDHPALFGAIHTALRPGGRLHAQCGGGPNLAHVHARDQILMRRPPFAEWFERWTPPWEFADAETAARRLAAAGFVDIATSVEAAPVVLPDAPRYRDFLTTVIFRDHLTYLPTEDLRRAFIDELTRLAAGEETPFLLDYWRLNLSARKR